MSTSFWIRRFFTVFAGAFLVIAMAQFLRHHTISYLETLFWATLSATIFTVGRIYQSRRGQHCAICKDTPEMQNGHNPSM